MSNSADEKNGSKVRVMYVRGKQDKGKPQNNERKTDRGRGFNDKPASPRAPKPKSSSAGPYQDQAPRHRSEKRVSDSSESANQQPYAAWKTLSTEQGDAWLAEEGQPGAVDPAIIRQQRAEETRVYGENGCKAIFQHRPESIIRAWFIQSVTPGFSKTLSWMAANRKAYHVIEEAEMKKVAGTDHHGGVCFIIKKRNPLTVAEYLQQRKNLQQDCVVAMESVANPHNLGGIVRSCAHFGVQGILLDQADLLESGAAIRTAEGGFEHIQPIDSHDLLASLEEFRRAGYTLVTTSSHKGKPLIKAQLPGKIVLVIGQENSGLSDSAWKKGDLHLSIDGSGNVESLNVSVATGILLAEWWRQNN